MPIIDLMNNLFGDSLILYFEMDYWFIILIFIIILGFLGIRYLVRNKSFGNFEIDETEIGIGNHKIKIKPNYDDLQIAFRLWTELSTRKIGLPIDEDNDVIVEIYNSWYEFFKITREMVSTIPVSKLRKNKSTRKIVEISIKILNNELRPHLTKWQAKFRRWYNWKLEDNSSTNLTPQEIQKEYPEYASLLEEMKKVNSHLVSYKTNLEKLVYSK